MLRFTRWSRRPARLAGRTAAAVRGGVLCWPSVRDAQPYRLTPDPAPERWWVPVVVGLLLTLAQVSDVLATFAGAAAVAVACGVRVGVEIVRRQHPLKSAGYDLWIGLAAVISIGLAHLVLGGIN